MQSRSRRVAALASIVLLLPGLPMLAPPARADMGPGPIVALNAGTPLGEALQAAGIPPCPGAAMCYVLQTPQEFAAEPLIARRVLVVGSTIYSDAAHTLHAKAAQIDAFVNNGGAVVAFSERQSFLESAGTVEAGRFAWVPQGALIGINVVGGDTVALTSAGEAHPAFDGQTAASLSGWHQSYKHTFTTLPPYLNERLAETGGAQPVVVAGEYGRGCVMLSGMNPDSHAPHPSAVGRLAARLLIYNTLAWALECAGFCLPCVPGALRHTETHEGPFSGLRAKVAGADDCGSYVAYDYISTTAGNDVGLRRYDCYGTELASVERTDPGLTYPLDLVGVPAPGVDDVFVVGRTYPSSTSYGYLLHYRAPFGGGLEEVCTSQIGPGNYNDWTTSVAAAPGHGVFLAGSAGAKAMIARYDLQCNAQWLVTWSTLRVEALDAYDDGTTVSIYAADSAAHVRKYVCPSPCLSAPVLAWDVPTGIAVWGAAASPDGVFVAGHVGWDHASLKRFDPGGTLQWTADQDFGNVGQAWDVALGPSGDPYIVGQYNSGGPTNYDAFVARYDRNLGQLVWTDVYPGPFGERFSGVAFSKNGDLLVVGLLGGNSGSPDLTRRTYCASP